MEVWLPEHPATAAVGPLPDEVALHTVPREGPLPPALSGVEFLVPPYGSRRVLEALPGLARLRVIQADSAGVDWIEGAVPPGVTLCSARGARDVPVAEWVLGALLRSLGSDEELHGSRVLIVGYGSIGRAVEERLEPFGVEVERIGSRPRPRVAGIERLGEALAAADAVVLLVPATAATERLIDAAALARLKDGALLVNAARGSVVDTDALLAELRSGRIRAALDVTDPEPLPGDHPLRGLDNVHLTPHVAGDSAAAERRVYRLVGEQIRRHLRGEPLLNVVAGG